MQETYNGIVVGIVESLDDPAGLARVQVRFPHLDDELSNWARLSSPMAGSGRGMFFRPEVNDEVLIAFEQGDTRRPYVLGSLWSDVDKPPPDDGQTKKNNWRFIRSRSGHLIKLDDTEGSEKIEIVTNDGQRSIVFDSAAEKIRIVCQSGDVEVTASGGNVKIEAQNVEVKASGDMNLEAGGTMNIKGATVNIN
jgi:uncharacterized protein involved in type VI secretion and phage assembly